MRCPFFVLARRKLQHVDLADAQQVHADPRFDDVAAPDRLAGQHRHQQTVAVLDSLDVALLVLGPRDPPHAGKPGLIEFVVLTMLGRTRSCATGYGLKAPYEPAQQIEVGVRTHHPQRFMQVAQPIGDRCGFAALQRLQIGLQAILRHSRHRRLNRIELAGAARKASQRP